jgi:protein FAM32A
MKTAFAGGSLSFKGDKKKKAKKKKSKTKHVVEHKQKNEETASSVAATTAAITAAILDPTADMTEAERKVFQRKQERQLKDLEKQASKSHRERVEEFNEKLASLTELNDIPRVSGGILIIIIIIEANIVDTRIAYIYTTTLLSHVSYTNLFVPHLLTIIMTG